MADQVTTAPHALCGKRRVRFTPFDAVGVLAKSDAGEGLGRRTVRSAGATMASQVLGVAVQIISTVTLARLLTPMDFGVVTMVTTFSLLLVNFGVNGFTEAVVQSDDLNDTLVSNLFWLNLFVGVVLTAVFASAGSLMARFYGNPNVAGVAVGISLTIVITSTSVLHLALLMRAMRFSLVAANDVVSRAVSVVVSIVCAWAGWGYWALVAGTVAQTLSVAVGAFFFCRWLPRRPQRGVAAVGSMVRFALNVYGRFTLNYLVRNVDNLLVGWRFNAQSLCFPFRRSFRTSRPSVCQRSAASRMSGNATSGTCSTRCHSPPSSAWVSAPCSRW
jgi:PST family polysaccharide transporter